jgi:hypothetical protein
MDLVVSIDCNAAALVASYPGGPEAHRISWDCVRQHEAAEGVVLLDARLCPVAVSTDGEVHWDGLPETGQLSGRVPPELRCVAAGGVFDPAQPKRGWTLSERWRVFAWSPLTATAEDGDCVWRRADSVEVARGPLFKRPDAPSGTPVLPLVRL